MTLRDSPQVDTRPHIFLKRESAAMLGLFSSSLACSGLATRSLEAKKPGAMDSRSKAPMQASHRLIFQQVIIFQPLESRSEERTDFGNGGPTDPTG